MIEPDDGSASRGAASRRAEVKDAPAETIVVDVPGKSGRTLALMAHYDSATVEADEDGMVHITSGGSHGAADDGYGVAASSLPSLYALMPTATDMSVFIPEGLCSTAPRSGRRTTTTTPRTPRAMSITRSPRHYGHQVLDLTRAWAFDGQAPTLTADGDLHFFQLWRGLTARYPEAVGTGLGVPCRHRCARCRRRAGQVPALETGPGECVGSGLAGRVGLRSSGAGAARCNGDEAGAGERARAEPDAAVNIRRRGSDRGRDHNTLRGAALEGGARAGDHHRGAAPADGRLRPIMVLVPGAAYVLVLTTLALALTALAPRRVGPVVGALAAFVIVVVFAPTVLLINQLLSLSMAWAPVLLAIVPVAPLVLTLLQAGGRRTAAQTSSNPDAALDGDPATGPATATA